MYTNLALDIGGTKIDVCTFDEEYNLLKHDTLQTQAYRIRRLEFAEDVKSIIRSYITRDTTKLGVSWNCSMNQGVILWSSLLGGSVNYPLVKELTSEFEIPVKADDDIHAMTEAELRFGEGKELEHFMLLNIGTGIGAGYVEGKVIRGASNLAGIYCFHQMYVEEFSQFIAIENLVSGRGIQEIYTRFTGVEKSAKEILEISNSEEAASETVAIFSKYLGKHLVDLTFFYNPSVIILNGSIAKSHHQFLPQAMEYYHREMEKLGRGMHDPRVPDLPPEHGIDWPGSLEHVVVSNLDYAACLGVLY